MYSSEDVCEFVLAFMNLVNILVVHKDSAYRAESINNWLKQSNYWNRCDYSFIHSKSFPKRYSQLQDM